MKSGVWAIAASVVLLAPSSASAIDRDSCAIPYEQAQALRKDRIFSAAREQLEICRAKCPKVLAADCTQWAAELRTLTPTVIFRVHGPDGHPVESFRTTIDGTLLTEAPTDHPVAVDPGEHVFRFEGPGFATSEVRATMGEGEHGRVVDVGMTPLAPPGVLPAAPSPVEPSKPASRTAAYVLASIGLAGLATGGALSIAGQVEKANLESDCNGRCSTGSVDEIRTVWWAGGIAAGVGAASLAVGAVLWFYPTRRVDTPRASSWAPFVGLGRLGVIGEF